MKKERIFGLDVLRAYAVLAVLYGHAYELVSGHFSGVFTRIYWLPVWDGVTLFFVLSGFLIGRIIILSFAKENLTGRDIIHFWFRRWTRTIPPYYVVLTATTLLWVLVGNPLPQDFYKYYLFIQNWNQPHPEYFWEAWSLSVEEWFYLLVPLGFFAIFRFFPRNAKMLIPGYISLVVLASVLYRTYVAEQMNLTVFAQWDAELRKQVVTRMDSLMLGVLGAYLSLRHERLWQNSRRSFLLAGCLLLIFDKIVITLFFETPFAVHYLNNINLFLTPLAFLLILPFFSTYSGPTGKSWHAAFVKLVTFISVISYSLYLVNHTLVREVLLRHMAGGYFFENGLSGAFAGYALHIIASFALGYAAWWTIERPVMILREKP